ncbi:MAG: 16S rRNA (cytosine(1402)-N(4))-methyltransferase RsmH [Oscillospiraceae bacterium]|nr:16S rRNA (cytosine(1402)-N(4))-methyltransferase RsmH [Oscillospiraceae bacterium]
MMEYTHKPVLLEECLDGLNIRPGGVYLDGTLGRAGHSLEIVKRLAAGRLIAIDRDKAALDAAPARFGEYLDRVTLVQGSFGGLAGILASLNVDGVDGMLFDLGVSSPQLDDGSRGFSYLQDAPLDMRMDQSAPLTARDVVNGWSQEELKRVLWQYGEERYAGPIAAAIARVRENAPIETTGQLAELIRSAMPAKARREKQHPAKRSFQAIRIAVNDELGELERLLECALEALNPGGRLAIISFHSLEDRLVKTAYARWARGCTCPPDFPVCVCGKTPRVKLVGRRPITAGEEELKENPRARSAKLRLAERL